MLMGLKAQVREGDSVPLTLLLEDPDGTKHTQAINAPVRPLTQAGTGRDDKTHSMH